MSHLLLIRPKNYETKDGELKICDEIVFRHGGKYDGWDSDSRDYVGRFQWWYYFESISARNAALRELLAKGFKLGRID